MASTPNRFFGHVRSTLKGWNVMRTTNSKGNIILEKYLNEYPLFGRKNRDFQNWSMRMAKTVANMPERKVNENGKDCGKHA